MKRGSGRYAAGFIWTVTLLVIWLGAVPASAQSGSFTFARIQYPGSARTEASGINNAGQVVGTYYDAIGFTHGFLFDGTTYTTIDYPGAWFTYVFGVGPAGQIVGGYSMTNAFGPYHGFLYQDGSFTDFDYPLHETDGRAINSAGHIVGIYNAGYGTPDRGFIRESGTFTNLHYPGATKTYTFGINDQQVITGTWVDAFNRLRGYWYFGGAFMPLNFPGASQTYVGGINNANVVTGWSWQGTLKTSYVATNGLASFRSFVVPFTGVTASLARAINDGGQVVGTYQSPECPIACSFVATPNPAGNPACSQTVALAYTPGTLTMNFTVRTSTPTTWTMYLYVNGIPYLLWSAPLGVVSPAASVSVPLALGPFGRVTGLSMLSTASGGVLCADYAVADTGTASGIQ